MNDKRPIHLTEVQNKIFTIRGLQVMMDSDLADIYGVETRVLNQAIKRNIRRFPSHFMFQLTKVEFYFWNTSVLKSQFVISKPSALGSQSVTLEKRGGRRKMPFAFTEHGVSMLSAILKSDTAIEISIQIMNAFVEMRQFMAINAVVFQRLENVEQKQLASDEKFEQLFTALENKSLKPKQGIFYDGQVFDAYVFVADLIKSAKSSIILIDNYIDESVLQLITKRHKNVSATVYTKNISKALKQDLSKHNAQYPPINLKTFDKAHDRFLIIDQNTVYHFGASVKDLGKKWFAFSKFDKAALEMLRQLKED